MGLTSPQFNKNPPSSTVNIKITRFVFAYRPRQKLGKELPSFAKKRGNESHCPKLERFSIMYTLLLRMRRFQYCFWRHQMVLRSDSLALGRQLAVGACQVKTSLWWPRQGITSGRYTLLIFLSYIHFHFLPQMATVAFPLGPKPPQPSIPRIPFPLGIITLLCSPLLNTTTLSAHKTSNVCIQYVQSTRMCLAVG